MSTPNNSRLQHWHESFSLLDEEEEEEDFEDEDVGVSARHDNNLNRDFLFYGGNAAAAAPNHNSFSLMDEPTMFELIPDATVVPRAMLSDSFIARSYPTASVLKSVGETKELGGSSDHDQLTSQPKNVSNSTAIPTKQKKKTKEEKFSSSSVGNDGSGSNGSRSEGSSNSSLDLFQAPTPHPLPRPAAAATATAHSSASPPATNESVSIEYQLNSDNNIAAISTANKTGNISNEFQQSMNLSQVFNTDLQRIETYMPPPPPKKAQPKQAKPEEQSIATNATSSRSSNASAMTEPMSRPSNAASASTLPTLTPIEPVANTALPQATATAPEKTAASNLTVPTPPADEVTAQEQREIWQQSMANDCLALDPPVPEKDTTISKDRSPDENNKKNDTLSDTVHTRSNGDGDDLDDKDDTSNVSDSYHDEGLDCAELAEEKESAVKKSLLYSILSAIGAILVWKYMAKCFECCKKGEDDNNQAAADLMGDGNANAGGGEGSNGNGSANGTANANASMVQQMAAAASQNAAASAAKGSQAMASSAAGAAGAGGVSTALIVAGALTAAAALTGGVIVAWGNNYVAVGTDLWMCDAIQEPLKYTGHVVLYLEGVNDSSWFSSPDQRAQLEQTFLQEYNQLGCQGTYQRVLESVKLHENDWEELVDGNTTFFRTNWTALVLCNGACPELEPLFYILAADYDPGLYAYSTNMASSATRGNGGNGLRGRTETRLLSTATTHRILQDTTQKGDVQQEPWFLLALAYNFSLALAADSSTKHMAVFDGYTLSPLDGSLVERIGREDRGSPFSMINVTQDILERIGSSSSQRPVFDDLVPQCEATTNQKEETGYMRMQVANMDCQALLAEESLLSQLQDLFRAIFNRVGLGCDGAFQRVMRSASLTNCTPMTSTDVEGGAVFFADMAWNGVVLCDGCSSTEPVFLESFHRLLRRRLEDAVFLETFVSNLTLALETYFDSADGALDTIYAATLSTGDRQSVVQFTGRLLSGVPLGDSPPDVSIFNDSEQGLVEGGANPDTGDGTNPDSAEVANPDSNAEEGRESSSNNNNVFDQNDTLDSEKNATSEIDQESLLCATENGETFSYENGRVNLMIENVPQKLMDFADVNNREMMEKHFTSAYNSVSGMCEGDFQRIVHNATLLDFTFGTRGDGAQYLDTNWKATVSCSGCNPKEPLFLGHQVSSSRALQMDVSSMLGKFSSELGRVLDVAFHLASEVPADDWQRLAVFFVQTLSSDGTEVMQSTGYHPQFYLNSGAGASRPRPTGNGPSQAGANDDMNTTLILEGCLKDLVVVDVNGDNMLSSMEYVKFVHRIFSQLDSSADMQQIQKDMPSFESLPLDLQEGFSRFSEGGTIQIYGDKKQEDVPAEQKIFLLGFCSITVSVTSAVISSQHSDDASGTSGSTTAPTEPFTTTAPSSISPTAAATSTPTSSPSNVALKPTDTTTYPSVTPLPAQTSVPSWSTMLPTPSPTTSFAAFATVNPLNPEVDMLYQLKFYIDYGDFVDRAATSLEIEGLRLALEAFFYDLIAREYEDSPETELINHDLIVIEAKYTPNPIEHRYSHSIKFASNFTFTGVNPPVKNLFEVYDQMSLQELTEKGVWAAKPRHGVFFYTAGILWTNGGSTTSDKDARNKAYDTKRSGAYLELPQQDAVSGNLPGS